jgi:hypothetical protein
MIKMEDGKHCLYSKDGSKKLGCFDTHEQAAKRERQIQFFKAKESVSDEEAYGRLLQSLNRTKVGLKL